MSVEERGQRRTPKHREKVSQGEGANVLDLQGPSRRINHAAASAKAGPERVDMSVNRSFLSARNGDHDPAGGLRRTAERTHPGRVKETRAPVCPIKHDSTSA